MRRGAPISNFRPNFGKGREIRFPPIFFKKRFDMRQKYLRKSASMQRNVKRVLALLGDSFEYSLNYSGQTSRNQGYRTGFYFACAITPKDLTKLPILVFHDGDVMFPT